MRFLGSVDCVALFFIKMKEKKRRKLPIRVKTALMMIVLSAIIVESAMLFFSLSSLRTNSNSYKKMADNLSHTISETIDTDKVKTVRDQVKAIVDIKGKDNPRIEDLKQNSEDETYLRQFQGVKESEDYRDLLDTLQRVQINSTKEVDSSYILYFDKDYEFNVYLVDSADSITNYNINVACVTGTIDDIYPEDRGLINDPTDGFKPTIVKDGTYGWVVTAGAPIYLNHDKNSEVVGYVMVDVSMYHIRKSQRNNILQLFFFLTVSMILVLALGLLYIHNVLLKPLKRLNNVSKKYDLSEPEETHESFKNLNIKSHDELYELSESMKKIENDVYEKIQELTKMNEELIASQQQAEKMRGLANKDSLTGVRNKTAYDNVIRKINDEIETNPDIEFGIAMIDLNNLKVINDEEGHDSGDAALIKLSNIVCGIFAHSPVFRIGGDEFVVILRNTDYQNSMKLIKEFNKKIEDLSKDEHLYNFEKTSASIGYSIYNKKEDTCAEDVFKRADEAMYERKRQMKAGRK